MSKSTRSHKGIAASEGNPLPPVGHKAVPTTPDPKRARCVECGERITYRRTTYGPNGRAGGWSHIGDGLAQYRSWHLELIRQ